MEIIDEKSQHAVYKDKITQTDRQIKQTFNKFLVLLATAVADITWPPKYQCLGSWTDILIAVFDFYKLTTFSDNGEVSCSDVYGVSDLEALPCSIKSEQFKIPFLTTRLDVDFSNQLWGLSQSSLFIRINFLVGRCLILKEIYTDTAQTPTLYNENS